MRPSRVADHSPPSGPHRACNGITLSLRLGQEAEIRRGLLDILHAKCKLLRLESLITIIWIHVVLLNIIEMKRFD